MKRRAVPRIVRRPETVQPDDAELAREQFAAAVARITPEAIDANKPGELDPEEPEEDERPERPPRDFLRTRIDLHRLTVAEAIAALESALGRIRESDAEALIIVGKGSHNPDGVGILRAAIPKWLESDGRRLVASWRWAERREGGRGAIVARLRGRPEAKPPEGRRR